MSHDAYERARAALAYLDYSDRDTWLQMAMAIKDEFGENGFELWDEWGAQHASYSASDAKSVWRSVKPGKGIGFGTLIHRAKQAGWKDEAKYQKPSAQEIEKRKQLAAERAAQAAAEEAQARAQAAEWSQKTWANAIPAFEHPYLAKKGIKAHGLRIGTWEVVDGETGEVIEIPGCLLVPVMDRSRKLHSLQGIEASGKKRYVRGGAKQGNFHVLGGAPLEHEGKKVFVLGEGYATAASLHEATGHLVLCCFDGGNLAVVAKALRERAPDAIIIIAADNDQWNLDKEGNLTNPGLAYANNAAAETGAIVVYPPFPHDAGTPGDGGPTDFNDWHLAHGLNAVAEIISAALWAATDPAQQDEQDEAHELEPAPAEPDEEDDLDGVDPSGHFTVLGYDRDYWFVFAHGRKQILRYTTGEIASESVQLSLAPLDWWEMHFPGDKGGVNKKTLLDWFFRLAERRGIYDLRRLRGRGAWMDDGRVVFHHGSHLTVNGEALPVTKIKTKYVYELAQNLGRPAETPLTDEDGKKILALAQQFRWSKPASAILLCGWIYIAPVCGAIRWRPHIWLTGGAGTGKSTILNQFVSQLLGPVKVFAQGNSTEAGIRQTLRCDALPVLFDESEQDDENEKRRMAPILALIRQASTESAAKTLKGTVGGDAMNYHIRSMFCLASIQAGIENKADTDRLTRLALLGAEEGSKAADNWAKLQDQLYELARDESMPERLLRRSLDNLHKLQQNVTVFVDAMARKLNSQRQGDQFGTLVAGAWSLCSTAVATPEQAKALIDKYDWSEFLEGGEVDDPEKALRAILEAKLSHKGEVMSVGSVVSIAAGETVEGLTLDDKVAKRILVENGMQIASGHLLFENGSTALKKLVSGTKFEADLRGQLLRLPGAKRFDPRRFGTGTQSRSVGIPLSMVVADESPI